MHADTFHARNRTGGRLRAAAERAARDTQYLAIGLVTSVVAMVVWIAAVSVSLSTALFVVGLPVALASAVAFRWSADLDRRNAALVLGRPLRGRYRDHGGDRFLERLSATLRDRQTWRDLVWLVVHSIVGLAFGSAAIALVAEAVALAVLPAWYWAIPGGVDLGIATVDGLGEAFIAAVFAVPLAAWSVALLRAMALAEAHLASALLGDPADGSATAGAWPAWLPAVSREPRAGLAFHTALAALAGFICTLVWALTSHGYFWPIWAWLGLAISVGLHVLASQAGRAGDSKAAFRVKVELYAGIAVVCWIVWALTSTRYLWPIWPMLGMGTALALRGLYVFRHRLPWVRERELVERVDELTRTRRGALDVQAAELRRIERDLHDGAQARLVALSMQLGRAEERLADQPDVADLVRQARGEATAAIAELRDLARGIAPPVLADRGLAAAIEGLARRQATPVAVEVALDRRPSPVIETGAYFVVAESLTNVAKHAPSATARVTVRIDPERLLVQVTDDGPGGADPNGNGLTGLRHRVEALDGSLLVSSTPGNGTTIQAELPCAS